MSERVPRMAPINNQGDDEVYTQYRQWPFNSTDMDGGNKTEGNQPNAYPGDEDAEDIGNNIFIGTTDEFAKSKVKRGILLRNNKVIWAAYGSHHGMLHGEVQQKFNKKPFSYDFYNLRVQGDELQPIRYQKVPPYKDINLSSTELNSIQKIFPQFKVVKNLENKNLKSVPSFMDFYKNKFKNLFHPGDEEELK
jgi:hypothetical protein